MRHGNGVKHGRRWALSLVLVAFGAIATIATLPAPPVHAQPIVAFGTEPIAVQAEQLDVDLRTSKAVLQGEVHLQRAGLHVWCDKLEALYDKAPTIRWAKASGRVRAKLGQSEATAREAELHWNERQLRLFGEVKLRHGGAWLAASDATIDLNTEKITLNQVRGAIPAAAVGASSAISATSVLPCPAPLQSSSSHPGVNQRTNPSTCPVTSSGAAKRSSAGEL